MNSIQILARRYFGKAAFWQGGILARQLCPANIMTNIEVAGLSLLAKKCYNLAMASTKVYQQLLSSFQDPQTICAIFEHLPEVFFFIKDRGGKIVAANSTVLERLGMHHISEFIGKTDADVYPKHLAEAYRADDQLVFESGKPLVDRLEVWLDETGQADWCVTTKLPLKDAGGKIVGLIGISRRDRGRTVLQPASVATRAVAYLRKNMERVQTIDQLAAGLRVSTRTLNRKINQDFGISPYELILRMRIQSAAETLIRTEDEISHVALSHGFCDQSHFIQHFRKRMGLTPKQFRTRNTLAVVGPKLSASDITSRPKS